MIRELSAISAGLTTSVTAYTSGDQVGNVFSFPGAVDVAGGRGLIVDAKIIDAADVMGACELCLFSALPVAAADNAPEAFSDADELLSEGRLSFATTDMFDSANNRVINYSGAVSRGFKCAATTLFATLTTRSANSFFVAVTDLTVILTINTGTYGIV